MIATVGAEPVAHGGYGAVLLLDGERRRYREALRALIDQTRSRHGRAWHLNLHSMPSNAFERLGLRSLRPLAADATTLLAERPGWRRRFRCSSRSAPRRTA